MNIFIGLVGRIRQGLDSASRGEGRWALNLIRCLKDYGHTIVIAPDMEECEWGSCPQPHNVRMYQPREKINLSGLHFDVAIFTSWLPEKTENEYIIADKYVWGVIGWKKSIMKNGFFNDNEYIARFTRTDLDQIPYPINFKDRCFLLAQPFGKKMGESKFANKRVAWIAKEAFLPEINPSLRSAGQRHFFATVDACKETGAGLSIFNCQELNPKKSPAVRELGILEKLKEIDDVRMYQSLPFPRFQEELFKCSVTMPFTFHGSAQESVFNGLVPLLYKDSGFGKHIWIGNTITDLTKNGISRPAREKSKGSILTIEEIKDITAKLLTDKVFFNEYLYRLRPMVIDNIDDHVVSQLDKIMKHNGGRK